MRIFKLLYIVVLCTSAQIMQAGEQNSKPGDDDNQAELQNFLYSHRIREKLKTAADNNGENFWRIVSNGKVEWRHALFWTLLVKGKGDALTYEILQYVDVKRMLTNGDSSATYYKKLCDYKNRLRKQMRERYDYEVYKLFMLAHKKPGKNSENLSKLPKEILELVYKKYLFPELETYKFLKEFEKQYALKPANIK